MSDLSPKASSMLAVLNEALSAWPESFDGGEAEINGGDLLEWFAEWREKAKAAAAGASPLPSIAIILEGGLVSGIVENT